MTKGELRELEMLASGPQPAYVGHRNRARSGVQNRLVLILRYACFLPTATAAETVEITDLGREALAVHQQASTHPLTPTALGTLREAARDPVLRRGVNPGVVDRLTREDLVEVVDLPSPWAAKGKTHASHLRITEAGRRRLVEITGSACVGRGCLAGRHRCGAAPLDLRAEIQGSNR